MMRDDRKWCTVGWFCWCRSCQLWNWNSGSEAGSGVPSSPSGTNQSATTISLLFSHPLAGLPWSLSPASTAMVSSIWYCDLLHIAPFSDFESECIETRNTNYTASQHQSAIYTKSKRTATSFRETIPKFPFNTGLFCIIFAAYRPRSVQGMKYCGWVRERSSLHEKTCSAGDVKGVGGVTGINGARLLMAK